MIYYNEARQRWIVEIDRWVTAGGKRKRVRKVKTLPSGTDEVTARRIGDAIEAKEFEKTHALKEQSGWDEYVGGLLEDKRSWIYTTLASCKHRAESLGREFNLSPHQLSKKMLETKGRCEVTGLAFSADHSAKRARQRPYIHSIDRIDSSKGYTPDNIRLVCFAVNMAMSNWGEEIFATLATGYVFNKYGAFQSLANAENGWSKTHQRKISDVKMLRIK